MEKIEVNRCVKLAHFKEIESYSLHHFSDTSNNGYETANYIRLKDIEGRIHCALMLGKSRVLPIKMN